MKNQQTLKTKSIEVTLLGVLLVKILLFNSFNSASNYLVVICLDISFKLVHSLRFETLGHSCKIFALNLLYRLSLSPASSNNVCITQNLACTKSTSWPINFPFEFIC